MMFGSESMRTFGGKIVDIMQKNNLTCKESKEMFRQVLSNEQPDLQSGAFLAALASKGETKNEIIGCFEAIYNFDTVKVTPSVTPLVENCGTGMDEIKTFNISTAASIVAAANGIYMAKHGARAISSTCGAIDILESVGIDVKCDLEIVKKSIERAGIGIFNGTSFDVHPKLARILSQIRFGTTLNIAASLANPASPKYGVRGVYSNDLVEPVARIMGRIGYRRAIVFHGLNRDGKRGIDEISSMGKTIVAELARGEIIVYTITPEDVGIERTDEKELFPALNREEEVLRFLRTLSGEEMARCDIVCLNTAPILYMMGKASNIKGGFDMAKETIESGRAIAKLKEWVREQNSDPKSGEENLDFLLERATA
jgi:anthranilate phosphoribosyltransferase (EC 2.4.2.18)